jgi:hypothetical protein
LNTPQFMQMPNKKPLFPLSRGESMDNAFGKNLVRGVLARIK